MKKIAFINTDVGGYQERFAHVTGNVVALAYS